MDATCVQIRMPASFKATVVDSSPISHMLLPGHTAYPSVGRGLEFSCQEDLHPAQNPLFITKSMESGAAGLKVACSHQSASGNMLNVNSKSSMMMGPLKASHTVFVMYMLLVMSSKDL